MNWLVILLGKLLIGALRLTQRGGSALPGLLAERLRPNLMASLLGQLEQGVVVVSGTNGKTTTTKALVRLLRSQGLRVLTNPSGSNFTRGIVSHLMEKSNLAGRLPYDIAVLELDEAYSRIFAQQVPPRLVLLLNVMRDQLDRYGEIDTTAQMLRECAQQATSAVVLNQDDPRVAAIAEELPAHAAVSWFGVSPKLRAWLPTDEELHGGTVKTAKTDSKNSDVFLATYSKGEAGLVVGGKRHKIGLSVDGIHNALNLNAALAAARVLLGGEADGAAQRDRALLNELAQITPAFGRGEIVNLGDKQITLALVKNPSGFRQMLSAYAHEPFDLALFAINDLFADGRDVSWLWDVEYSGIKPVKTVVASGLRANDMALRLQYDNITNVEIEPDLAKSLDKVIAHTSQSAIIYCTYTAMLALRKSLAKQTKLEGIWHEQ